MQASQHPSTIQEIPHPPMDMKPTQKTQWMFYHYRKLTGCFTLMKNSLAHRTSHRHKKHYTIRRYTNHHLHHRHKERPPIHIRIMVLYT
jgi:hypothetical protein